MEVQVVFSYGIMPTRGTQGSVGMDLYTPGTIELQPGVITKVPLGFKAALPYRSWAELKEKSGLALKGIHILGGIIDYDYRDEWAVIMMSDGRYTFEAGKKIAQVIVYPDPWISWREVESLDVTERKGGFGSTS